MDKAILSVYNKAIKGYLIHTFVLLLILVVFGPIHGLALYGLYYLCLHIFGLYVIYKQKYWLDH